jgi:hypothetical protein
MLYIFISFHCKNKYKNFAKSAAKGIQMNEGCLFLVFFLLMNLHLLTKKISVYFKIILKKKQKISSQNIGNNFVMCFETDLNVDQQKRKEHSTYACHL